MTRPVTRRQALKGLGAAGAALVLRIDTDAQGEPLSIAGQPVELRLASLSANTLRFSVLPKDGTDADLNRDGGLVQLTEQRRTIAAGAPIKLGPLSVSITTSPVVLKVSDGRDRTVQEISVDAQGVVEFLVGDAPLLGFGEGGAQFDRRGNVDAMRNGQGGYRLQTHGGRVPVQWLIGTEGWGLFIHQPFGAFDLSGPKGKLTAQAPLPIDCFVVVSKDPEVIMTPHLAAIARHEEPGVLAVGEEQDDAPSLLVVERGHRQIGGVPQRRGSARPQLLVDDAQQRRLVAGQQRADRDFQPEAAEARAVVGPQRPDEGAGGVADARQFPRHAVAHVEHHRDGDLLRRVVEHGDRARLAVLEDLEVVARQVGHQAAVPALHRGVGVHRARGGLEGGATLLREQSERERGGQQSSHAVRILV